MTTWFIHLFTVLDYNANTLADKNDLKHFGYFCTQYCGPDLNFKLLYHQSLAFYQAHLLICCDAFKMRCDGVTFSPTKVVSYSCFTFSRIIVVMTTQARLGLVFEELARNLHSRCS